MLYTRYARQFILAPLCLHPIAVPLRCTALCMQCLKEGDSECGCHGAGAQHCDWVFQKLARQGTELSEATLARGSTAAIIILLSSPPALRTPELAMLGGAAASGGWHHHSGLTWLSIKPSKAPLGGKIRQTTGGGIMLQLQADRAVPWCRSKPATVANIWLHSREVDVAPAPCLARLIENKRGVSFDVQVSKTDRRKRRRTTWLRSHICFSTAVQDKVSMGLRYPQQQTGLTKQRTQNC